MVAFQFRMDSRQLPAETVRNDDQSLQAAVSEQLARMVAMKSATDAAKKMGKSLKRDFNRARQASITTELSEIIGGAAALE